MKVDIKKKCPPQVKKNYTEGERVHKGQGRCVKEKKKGFPAILYCRRKGQRRIAKALEKKLLNLGRKERKHRTSHWKKREVTKFGQGFRPKSRRPAESGARAAEREWTKSTLWIAVEQVQNRAKTGENALSLDRDRAYQGLGKKW